MPPLYLVEQGARLSHEGRRLIVSKEGETLLAVPLVQVSEVLIFGNIQVTTQTIKLLLGQGIDLVFLHEDGHYCGRLVGTSTRFGELRRLQYERSRDPAFVLALAQRCVEGKLRNIRTLLQRYQRERQDRELSDAIEALALLIERVPRTQNLHSLQGVEGRGSAIYFGSFKRLFKDDWGFTGRTRRPPLDPLNVLLSLGYTLLLHVVESAVHMVGLDPYIGFLHAVEYGRPALPLDLLEEFRPVVVDSLVLRVCNTQQIQAKHFHRQNDPERPILLDEEGRRLFIAAFAERMAAEFIHPHLGQRVTYRRCIELQVRHLAECLKTAEANYRPFTVR